MRILFPSFLLFSAFSSSEHRRRLHVLHSHPLSLSSSLSRFLVLLRPSFFFSSVFFLSLISLFLIFDLCYLLLPSPLSPLSQPHALHASPDRPCAGHCRCVWRWDWRWCCCCAGRSALGPACRFHRPGLGQDLLLLSSLYLLPRGRHAELALGAKDGPYHVRLRAPR